MNKTFIIIRREYLSRVKKKSFLLLTFLTPVLIAGIYAFMIWMMTRDDDQVRKIAIVNDSQLVEPVKDSKYTNFLYLSTTFDEAKTTFKKDGFYAVLHIPGDVWTKNEIILHSKKQVTIDLKQGITRQIRRHIEKIKMNSVIADSNIPDLEKKIASTKTPISIRTLKVDESGEAKESSTEIAVGISISVGMLIYMFIFLYGSQVMRGVIEEKSNRVVEVLISSVKPFQLMMGKIIGVAMVGLTQFLLWVILSGIIITVVSALFIDIDVNTIKQASEFSQLPANSGISSDQFEMANKLLSTFDMSFLIGLLAAFLFYFIGGYLLYSALFAAVGSAVDNETETQQFMLPVTLPLVLALYIAIGVAVKTPEGGLAFWSSMIPFTSPIVM